MTHEDINRAADGMTNDEINSALYEAKTGVTCPHSAVTGFRETEGHHTSWKCDDCGAIDNFPDESKSPFEIPDYYHSIEACLGEGGLVEWMRKEKEVGFQLRSEPKGWVAYVVRYIDGGVYAKAEHESLPTAISIAAFEALGLEKEEK